MKAVALALIALAACSGSTPEQPMPFNHAVHVARQGVDCTTCHPGATTAAQAGLPAIAVCLSCHMRPQGDPPSVAEARVRAIAAAGGPFRWTQVTRNAGHVYFSHRAHTVFAEMSCESCHGAVQEWIEPPSAPNPALVDMDACMSCHRERGVSNECKTCHR
ncbi:MAG TPA: cytochrome c3 family protein [Kofleriaceae bacterium]|nr:cytochrome c3 family protein [Kofleriaceae bacterium]